MSDASTREANLLIIRRGGAAELETPKGGVWKIAYADFMTAMMAFFLVMWLINATSETTKTGIANYFNPIKLSDGMHLPQKGLHDPEDEEFAEIEPAKAEAAKAEFAETADGSSEAHETGAEQTEEAERHATGRIARYTEEALFRDPYAVLAAIAAEADGTTSLVSRGGAGASGVFGGEDGIGSDAYGDPFDPGAWYVHAQPAMAEGPLPSDSGREHEIAQDEKVGPVEASVQAAGAGPAEAEIEALPMASAQTEGEGDLAGDDHVGGAGESEPAEHDHAGGGGESDAAEHAGGAGEGEAAEYAGGDGAAPGGETSSLQEMLAEALRAAPDSMPNVTIEQSPGGVLISLADQVEFGMFAIGSAEPLPETIAVMERIAGLLKDMPGRVIIRGHTDARPFRSGGSDNWRLSSARAHMAFHMLVRGGLDETRVERIEGYADRDLKLPDSPEAAENRRIEVLVQEASS